jgi:hypothetical protein
VALPISLGWAFVLVGVVLAVVAAGLGYLGYKKLPRQPLPKTQERLKKDFQLTKESLA